MTCPDRPKLDLRWSSASSPRSNSEISCGVVARARSSREEAKNTDEKAVSYPGPSVQGGLREDTVQHTQHLALEVPDLLREVHAEGREFLGLQQKRLCFSCGFLVSNADNVGDPDGI